MEGDIRSPEKMAEHLVNKRLAQAIADRMHSIKVHQAEIKKLEKEVEKIKSGELVPDADEESAYTQKIKPKRNYRGGYAGDGATYISPQTTGTFTVRSVTSTSGNTLSIPSVRL